MGKVSDHKQLLIKAYLNNPPVNPKYMKEWVKNLISHIGMELAKDEELEANPIAYYEKREGNEGLTCCAILTTSSCEIHVWDKIDQPIMHFDLYSCSNFVPEDIFPLLDEFEPTRIEYKFLDRDKDLKEVHYPIFEKVA